MRNLSPGILLALLLAAPAPAQTAAAPPTAQPKFAVVDVRLVFNKYYKSAKVEADINARKYELERQMTDLQDDYTKQLGEYSKLMDASGDPTISAAEREHRRALAEEKVPGLKAAKDYILSKKDSGDKELNAKALRGNEALMADIKAVVEAKGKAGGYNYVLDKTAVVYLSGGNDITDDVLKELNAGAPPPSAASPDPSKPLDKASDKGDIKKNSP